MHTRPGTMLIAIHLVAEPLAAAAQEAPVVETAFGPVRGVASETDEAFLGIPYAAPPLGELRWRPTAEAEPWTEAQGATAFSAPGAAAESNNGPCSEAEDCLFFNV